MLFSPNSNWANRIFICVSIRVRFWRIRVLGVQDWGFGGRELGFLEGDETPRGEELWTSRLD